MIKLFIDPITKKINGYTKILSDDVFNGKDDIVITDEKASKLFSSISLDNLFYIDDEIIEKDYNEEDYEYKMDILLEENSNLSKIIQNESKLLIDSVLNGLSLEEATNIINKNRNDLETNKNKINELISNHNDDIANFQLDKMKQEEEKIDYLYYASILLLIRDENEYLEEWLDHFINILKIDHIYIYDNESKVPVKEYLESIDNPYVDKITFIDWATTDNTQEDACNHFLNTYGNETKWIAPVDTDEFIQLNSSYSSITDLLKDNENYSSVLCQWVHYGASGQEKKTSGGVMERFTQQSDTYDFSPSGKRFIQTNRCDRFIRYNPILRLHCEELNNENNNKELFQLNHYITKSYEEWQTKISRGSCDPNVRRKEQLFFTINPDMEYLNNGEDREQGYGSGKESKE